MRFYFIQFGIVLFRQVFAYADPRTFDFSPVHNGLCFGSSLNKLLDYWPAFATVEWTFELHLLPTEIKVGMNQS